MIIERIRNINPSRNILDKFKMDSSARDILDASKNRVYVLEKRKKPDVYGDLSAQNNQVLKRVKAELHVPV